MKTEAMIIPLRGTVKTTPKTKNFPHIAIICILSMLVFMSPISVDKAYEVSTDYKVIEYVEQELCGSIGGWYGDTLYAVANGVTHKVWYDGGVQVDTASLTEDKPVKIDNWNEIVAQAALTVPAYRKPVRELPDLSDIKDLTPKKDNSFKIKPVVDRSKQIEYVKRYAKIAKIEKEKYGIPASIKLAQGILESASGESELAVRNKNHFGIKCRTSDIAKGCSGKYYDKIERSLSKYTNYTSAWGSFRDHSLLLSNERYGHLKSKCGTNYKCWAKGLKKAGYATDKKYVGKLIDLIEELELYKYD